MKIACNAMLRADGQSQMEVLEKACKYMHDSFNCKQEEKKKKTVKKAQDALRKVLRSQGVRE